MEILLGWILIPPNKWGLEFPIGCARPSHFSRRGEMTNSWISVFSCSMIIGNPSRRRDGFAVDGRAVAIGKLLGSGIDVVEGGDGTGIGAGEV